MANTLNLTLDIQLSLTPEEIAIAAAGGAVFRNISFAWPGLRIVALSAPSSPLHNFRAGDVVILDVSVENTHTGRRYEIGDSATVKWLDASGENLVFDGEISVHYTSVHRPII